MDLMNIKGHFKLESIRDGVANVEVEDNNLIVNNASILLSNIISGSNWTYVSGASNFSLTSAPFIGRIAFGVAGHNTSNPTAVRTDWPNPAVTSLYDGKYNYNFEPRTAPTSSPTLATNTTVTNNETGNTVYISKNNNVLQYVVTIPKGNADDYTGVGISGSTTGFSEAALYMGGSLFAMKCFPWKPKDSQTDWKVTWTITL